MRKIVSLFTMLMLFTVLAIAQTRPITGRVLDESGQPVPGASITIKGTTTGTAANASGDFTIDAKTGDVLVVSAVGIGSREVTVGSGSSVNVTMTRTAENLSEVVVTALGIRKTRNQVAYAAQQVSGEEVSKTRTSNFMNNLSGKVSGLEIRQTNTLGGSTNVVLRGVKSITGNNQALFVVDGVPYDNSLTNSANQRTGRGGYDYGNAAADINPDDIESITVLKGAAASALYGSRGNNGVIQITTKKGTRGLGITVNSGISRGSIDKSTFIEYQKQYGAGYGQYYEDPSGFFLYRDINGDGTDDLVAPLSEDASYGAPFDPNKQVYQWDAFDPASPNFGKSRPWVAGANDPSSFFINPISTNNSVYIDGASDKGSFKLGYTRNDDRGVMPNSKVTKNIVNFGGTYNITDKLVAGGSISYTNMNGTGRYGTGYDDKNLMTNFRQWWQTNVDIKEQKEAYFRNRKNVTWNWADPTDLHPIYWDNPYFTRHENFQNDTRNRYFGNVNLNYKANDWLSFLGRIATDTYSELQEERQAVGSVTTSQYQRTNRNYNETNFDLMANIDKNLSTDINFKALLGTNIRKQRIESIYSTTNGGLIVPRIYSLSNSASAVEAPIEADLRREIVGIFGGVTFTYKNFLTLDGTIRRDASSTLPKGNNQYYYPSASLGFTFSQLMKSATWLSYGKLRANYAQVGADAPFYSTKDAYAIISPFGAAPQASVLGTRNNAQLKPEKTTSVELGLEMAFAKNRFGFDVTWYRAETKNQILPTTVSTATGYSSKFLNAGTMRNSGIELSAFITPVRTTNFSWTMNVNWTRNRNKVVELFEGSSNLLLATFQGGVSINATLDQPYGTLRGSNFTYLDPNNPTPETRLISATTGRYIISTTANQVIGNPNPDWIGGINNSLKYKNIGLSWLIDMRQGGDVFSLDLYYGLATGLYPETAANNDLGNPLRSPVIRDANGVVQPTSGGIVRQGVTPDGKPNTFRSSAVTYGAYGYRYSPAGGFVYDASFVKLREVVLTYSLPTSVTSKFAKGIFKGIDFNLIGRNLWIIHKNLPYADPEETVSSGNLQGYQSGAYPTTRTMTFNVKLRF